MILGFTGGLNNTLEVAGEGHFRLHLILPTIFTLIAVAISTTAYGGRNKGLPARPMTLTEIYADEINTTYFVELEGVLDDSSKLEIRYRDANGRYIGSDYYLPIWSDDGTKGILVRSSLLPAGSSTRVKLTGDVVTLTSDLERLSSKKYPALGKTVSYEFVPSAVSGNTDGLIWPALFFGLIAFAFWAAMALKNTFFHPEPNTIPRIRKALRGATYTGLFELPRAQSSRFFSMVHGWFEGDSESIRLLGLIDASEHVFYIKIKDMAGAWAIVIPRARISSVERGVIFHLLSHYPALCIRYRDAVGRKRKAFAMFNSTADRMAFQSETRLSVATSHNLT